MPAQNSLNRLGGITPIAGVPVAFDFRGLPNGPVKNLYLEIAFTIKSAAAAFAAVVNTDANASAEGVDDTDLLLAAWFSLMACQIDSSGQGYLFNRPPVQLRTVLGMLNQRDLVGSWRNGASVPISSGSANNFVIGIKIPISLEKLFPDGRIFQQGSERMKYGNINLTAQAGATVGNGISVVLANGTATVTLVTLNVTSETGVGLGTDVGPSWQANRTGNLTSSGTLDPATRLALLHTTPANTSTVQGWNVGDTNNIPPSTFATQYEAVRCVPAGYDVSFRATTLKFMPNDRKVDDLQADINRPLHYDALGTGISSIQFDEIKVVSPDPEAASRIATALGGQTSTTNPNPPSIPVGGNIPAALLGIMPIRIEPTSAVGNAPGYVHHDSPAALATHVATRNAFTSRAGAAYASQRH